MGILRLYYEEKNILRPIEAFVLLKLKGAEILSTDIMKALLTFLTNPFKLKLLWAPYGYIMKKKIF